jgi:carbon starvation protein CstA
MNAAPLVIGAIAFFILAYRFYYSFIMAEVLTIEDLRTAPAHRMYDGQNYYPMSKWVLFGSVMAGAVHDLVILFASIRHDGKSLAEIARAEISKFSSTIASLAILIILIVALAGMGLVVVNALAESTWGTFTIAMTIPIAVFMGFWMFRFRKGKTGEAVSLAVGMAQIFSSIPGLGKLMSYWYHFAIMFEALFILTIIDAGTRIARFVLQEALGKVYKPFGVTNWLPGNLITSLLVVFAWGYFVYTGSVSTIWPMFGTANQLLACLALAVGTSYIINIG